MKYNIQQFLRILKNMYQQGGTIEITKLFIFPKVNQKSDKNINTIKRSAGLQNSHKTKIYKNRESHFCNN